MLFYKLLIDGKRIEAICMFKVWVCVPANKIIVDSFTTDIADLFAGIYPERRFLRFRSVLNRIICAVISMEVDCELLQTPLCVKRNWIRRHCGKRIRISLAIFVVVPTKEDKSVIFCSFILSCDIGLVIYACFLKICEFSTVDSFYRVSASVYKDAVIIMNIVLIAGITEIQVAVIVNPACRRCARPITA